MRKLHVFASALIVAILLASCGVAGNGFGGSSIQKRKYTKGFYHNKNHGFKTSDDKVAKGELMPQEEEANETSVASLEKKTVQTTVLQSDKTIKSDQTQQPQRSDEKSTQKKKVTSTKKEVKSTPVRQRKQREHEYYVPMKEKASMQKMAAQGSSGGAMLVLLVILAIIIPPLAVGIFEGITTRFWIDLILAIVGFGIGFALFGGGLAWLCGLAAVIYALLIVLEVI